MLYRTLDVHANTTDIPFAHETQARSLTLTLYNFIISRMRFSTTLLSAVLVVSVSSVPVRRDVNPALVPDLGFTAGKNPTGTGDCDGAVNGPDGKPIKIPCACPPDRATFLAVRPIFLIASSPTSSFLTHLMYP
jgi:hypothetical protein